VTTSNYQQRKEGQETAIVVSTLQALRPRSVSKELTAKEFCSRPGAARSRQRLGPFLGEETEDATYTEITIRPAFKLFGLFIPPLGELPLPYRRAVVRSPLPHRAAQQIFNVLGLQTRRALHRWSMLSFEYALNCWESVGMLALDMGTPFCSGGFQNIKTCCQASSSPN
jgi:hypothetical protein